MRLHAVEHALDIVGIGAVAAEQPVPAEQPEIAGRLTGCFGTVRDLVRIGEAGSARG